MNILTLVTPFARVRASTNAFIATGTIGLFVLLWLLVPADTFPKPWEVLQRLNYLITERGLLPELMMSARLNLEALAITTVLSLSLCYLFVMPVMRPLVLILAGFRYWGLVGFTFIFMTLITDAHWVKVVIIVFGMSPYFIASMAEAVASTSEDELNHAYTMKMGPWRTLWEVVIRGKIHFAVEIMRQCAAIGWMMVAMVEGLSRSEGGIGVMLAEQSRYLKLEDIIAVQLVLLAVGLTQDIILRFGRNQIAPYANLEKGAMGQ